MLCWATRETIVETRDVTAASEAHRAVGGAATGYRVGLGRDGNGDSMFLAEGLHGVI